MINSLNFHGIIGKIFDVEVFKGFMHIKYLEYFSTEAYFQRNIDREHIKNIIDFIDNDNKEFKIFPEIVIMLPEDIKSAEVHIRRNVVKSFGGELSQIQFKNLDKLKKEKLCKIIDGNHRVKAFLKSESYQKHIASDADAQVAISFINTKRGEIEAKAFFYYLNSKSKRLMSGDFFNYLEDKSSAPDDLKKIDKELYYFKKTYDEIKKVINGKFEEEEVAIRDGILKIAQEFAKSKHEQEYFDLILKGLIPVLNYLYIKQLFSNLSSDIQRLRDAKVDEIVNKVPEGESYIDKVVALCVLKSNLSIAQELLKVLSASPLLRYRIYDLNLSLSNSDCIYKYLKEHEILWYIPHPENNGVSLEDYDYNKELDIYTVTGHYVGRVADVILNIRLGTISKLQVRAIEPEKKQVGFRDLMKRSFQVAPEEEHDVRSFKNDLLTIDFDKVQAIGDIMLINPRDMKKVRWI